VSGRLHCLLLGLLSLLEVLPPRLVEIVQSFLVVAKVRVEDGPVKEHLFKLEDILSVVAQAIHTLQLLILFF